MGEALITQNPIAVQEKSLIEVGPISHIGTVVNDVDEAARFYGERCTLLLSEG